MSVSVNLLMTACLVGSLVGGLIFLRIAYLLLARRTDRYLKNYQNARPEQLRSLQIGHGLVMAAVGTWYCALPVLIVTLEAPARLFGALLMVGVGIGLVGELRVRRSHGLDRTTSSERLRND